MTTPVDQLSFEEAMKSLDEILARMDDNTLSLEETMAAYERGMALSAHCQRLLKASAEKIEALKAQATQGGSL